MSSSNPGKPGRKNPIEPTTPATETREPRESDIRELSPKQTGTMGQPSTPGFGEQAKKAASSTFEDVKSGAKNVAQQIKGTAGEVKRDVAAGAPAPSNWAPTEEVVDKLNELLRGELAAVETYNLAMGSVTRADLASTLLQVRDSHQKRAAVLRARILVAAAEPATSSGAWGVIARLVQRGADLLGDKTAISALEEGEDRGLERYTDDLDELDASTRQFIAVDLLPEQRRTHGLVRSLERFLKAS